MGGSIYIRSTCGIQMHKKVWLMDSVRDWVCSLICSIFRWLSLLSRKSRLELYLWPPVVFQHEKFSDFLTSTDYHIDHFQATANAGCWLNRAQRGTPVPFSVAANQARPKHQGVEWSHSQHASWRRMDTILNGTPLWASIESGMTYLRIIVKANFS